MINFVIFQDAKDIIGKYCKRNGEICKIKGDIQDKGRNKVSRKNFSSICFVIIKKKGDCEEDVHHQ